jgi:mono/diheme cytochrome c family protein
VVRLGRSRLLVVLGAGLAIQLVPYGRRHENPAVVKEPAWDRTRTRDLFFRACKDCHSHETTWPWYSSLAPVSWLVQRDVEEGRSHFDVSDWNEREHHGDEAAKLVRQGEMPPWFYLLAHPEARLSDADREAFVLGLVATFGEAEAGRSQHSHDR